MTEPRKIHTNVADLPKDQQDLVRKMLVESATFEDVLGALGERGGDGVALPAVEKFFRTDPQVQAERVRHQLEAAKALKKAIGNPRTAAGKLADAILLTGYTGLTRQGGLGLKDLERSRLQNENLHLRQQMLRLRRDKAAQDRSLNAVRIRVERARLDKLRVHLNELRSKLVAVRRTQKMTPETYQKIQEIYGLISEPVVAYDPEKGTLGVRPA